MNICANCDMAFHGDDGFCSDICRQEYPHKIHKPKNDKLTVNVSLKDTDVFEKMISILKDITFDEDIPKLKRLEYYNRVLEILPEVDRA